MTKTYKTSTIITLALNERYFYVVNRKRNMKTNTKLNARAKILIKLIGDNLGLYLLVFIATTITIFMRFVPANILAELFDHVLGDLPSRYPYWLRNLPLLKDILAGDRISQIWFFGLSIVLSFAIQGLANYFKGIYSAKASENVAQDLRNRLMNHIVRLPYVYHVEASTGDLIQRCTSDIETVRRFLNVQFISMYNSLMMVAIAFSLMAPVSLKVTLLGIGPVPLMLIYSYFFFKKVIQAFERTEKAEAVMNAVLQENLSGIRIVQAFGTQKHELDKFTKANTGFFDAAMKAVPIDSMYWTGGDFFSAVQGIIILITCVLETYHGRLSVGDLIVLTTYSGMLLGPTRQLGRILSDAGRSLVALGRIYDIFDTPIEKEHQNALRPPINKDIEFHNVSLSYDQKRKVLDGVSFSVKSGETFGILGNTGSGKSSLVHLLQRLYSPTEGKITIGGVDLQDMDSQWLRNRIGLVLQESFLFNRTIYDNVTIAASNSDRQHVISAVEDVQAKDFIENSTNGYDTLVGERGVTLSGGQRQRLSIARTLLKDNDVLIFDDSLSAVDSETEAAIRSSLDRRSKEITTIIISHRITSLMTADHIIVLQDGKIVQEGTHEQLIKQPGLYQQVYEIQIGSGEEYVGHQI